MKKRLISIVFILLCISTIYSGYLYEKNYSEKVYLVGKVIGFNIEEKQSNFNTNLIKTSSKSVGILTFIKENNSFAAVGHQIDSESSAAGKCYNVDISNIEKSKTNSLGKINASLNKSQEIATVQENSNHGIFGTTNLNKYDYVQIDTESRFLIEKGIAYILLDLDNNGTKKYIIEITDIDYFSENQNLKINILDDDLINLTGGMIQGMSGAPIIQNDKLVGAVNFANQNDPRKGYGIFIDKLLK